MNERKCKTAQMSIKMRVESIRSHEDPFFGEKQKQQKKTNLYIKLHGSMSNVLNLIVATK